MKKNQLRHTLKKQYLVHMIKRDFYLSHYQKLELNKKKKGSELLMHLPAAIMHLFSLLLRPVPEETMLK